MPKKFGNPTKCTTFAPIIQGSLTEWLGSGLQNRVQQFESAGNLFLPHSFSIYYTKSTLLFPIFLIFLHPK